MFKKLFLYILFITTILFGLWYKLHNSKHIVLFGSFQCYTDYFKPAMKYFKSQNWQVDAPIDSEIVDLKEDFIKFVKDEHIAKDIEKHCNHLLGKEYTKCAESFEKKLQQAVFDKTRKHADIAYIINKDHCHIGIGTASETGYVLGVNDTRNDYNKSIFIFHILCIIMLICLPFCKLSARQALLLMIVWGTFQYAKQIKLYSTEEATKSHIRFFVSPYFDKFFDKK